MKFSTRTPSLVESLIPVIFLVLMLSLNVMVFGENSLEGSIQMVLLLATAVAAVVAIRTGHSYDVLQEGIVRSIAASMPSVLNLLFIGALSGAWLISGIVPAMIYYGLNLLEPSLFLFASCVICGMVALITGSSWSTIATIGVALLGIGKTLGVNENMVAGAIISGAYFGEHNSPMSDTSNLASAVTGTNLFRHVKHVVYTTIPAMGLALLLFLILGFSAETKGGADVDAVQQAIKGVFFIHPVLFVVPGIVIFLIVRQVPPIPVLLIGILGGVVVALLVQPDVVYRVAESGNDTVKGGYVGVMKAVYGEINIKTGHPLVNELLTTRGMGGMLKTVWLILCAMAFGGVMETSGLLGRITASIISVAHSTGSLIASTAGACVFFNITTSDQYLAVMIPGRMYSETYRERGLAPENLSRTLADAGSVTSVLVPWNSCGATQTSVLGVATGSYLPYCFFNLLQPVVTVIFGYMKWKIERLKKERVEKEEVMVV